jgi:hypothetical protein
MHGPTIHHDEHDDTKATMVFSPEFIVTIVPSWASCLQSSRRRVQRRCIGTRSS